MKTKTLLWCFLIACLVPCLAHAYMRIHPENPHYFQETDTGEPVLITSYTNIVTHVPAWDYAIDVHLTAGWGFDYCRVWHFGGCDGCELPFALTGELAPCQDDFQYPCDQGVTDPQNDDYKVDLDVWNPAYWSRLKDAMALARDAGIYAEIHLFNGCEFSPAECDRWGNSPWAGDNNVNGIETPPCDGDGTPDIYDFASRPNLAHYQERWISKLVDETIEYPNIIYEIENEHRGSGSPAFGDHYGQFIKQYIGAAYPLQPRLVSYSSIDADLEDFYTLPGVDIVNRHFGNEPEADPSILNDYIEPRWSYGKPINIDEFGNGLGSPDTMPQAPDILREMCWTIIASGGHFHIEDAAPEAEPFEIVQTIDRFKRCSGWDFVHASPDSGMIVSGGGYCMKNPGAEYVCYHPAGGAKTLTLEAGTYTARFWNPRTGGYFASQTFEHAGGDRVFDTPDAGDWVLHVRRDPLPQATLRASGAPPITIDGIAADWNLDPGAQPSRGGEAAVGDVAIVGYDGPRCYAAGHLMGAQYPPADGNDHAARIHARHSTTTLYLLVEIADSDRNTAAAADANWQNDGVEIYLDPGHAGGASAIESSSSAVQLVVDAAGQVNAYQVTPSYGAQVVGGVTAAVGPAPSGGAPGYTIEIAVSKSAFSPAILAGAGTIGAEFILHDSDAGGDRAQSTFYSWCDPFTSTAYPAKVPDRWGDLALMDPSWVPPDEGPDEMAADAADDRIVDNIDAPDGTGDDSSPTGDGDSGPSNGCGCSMP
jgi:hypothetical protein